MLVVEDDLSITRMIIEELQDHGFTVIAAQSADDAVHILNGGARVDIVFSDIQMPGRMTGIDLAHHVRKSAPTVPVILTSGRATAFADTPMVAFISKPYAAADVVRALRNFLPLQTPPISAAKIRP